ncbi:50S ribosomal protein L23 [bacterium]|nr:50S ribosomal protein L23 [bacterium]
MALLNFFKKKKKEEKKEKAKAPEIQKEPSVPEPPKKREVQKRIIVAPLVLKSAQVSEKATGLARDNQYVFKVFPGSSKQEIKKAVEEVYGVEVVKVRTIKVRRKQRRLGRTLGWRKGYQKAIVTLKEGQKIEILPR